MSTGTALIVSSLITAAATGAAAVQAHQDATAAEWEQKQSQEKAERAQKEANERAEKQRLEGLKSNAEATDYGNIWGVDTNTKKYADAAQKLSAGTGSLNTNDEDENPFYTRGLL